MLFLAIFTTSQSLHCGNAPCKCFKKKWKALQYQKSACQTNNCQFFWLVAEQKSCTGRVVVFAMDSLPWLYKKPNSFNSQFRDQGSRFEWLNLICVTSKRNVLKAKSYRRIAIFPSITKGQDRLEKKIIPVLDILTNEVTSNLA